MAINVPTPRSLAGAQPASSPPAYAPQGPRPAPLRPPQRSLAPRPRPRGPRRGGGLGIGPAGAVGLGIGIGAALIAGYYYGQPTSEPDGWIDKGDYWEVPGYVVDDVNNDNEYKFGFRGGYGTQTGRIYKEKNGEQEWYGDGPLPWTSGRLRYFPSWIFPPTLPEGDFVFPPRPAPNPAPAPLPWAPPDIWTPPGQNPGPGKGPGRRPRRKRQPAPKYNRPPGIRPGSPPNLGIDITPGQPPKIVENPRTRPPSGTREIKVRSKVTTLLTWALGFGSELSELVDEMADLAELDEDLSGFDKMYELFVNGAINSIDPVDMAEAIWSNQTGDRVWGEFFADVQNSAKEAGFTTYQF